MKFCGTLLMAGLFTLSGAQAQWLTRTYPLVTGWNGVWLAGDASYTTVTDLFSSWPAVTEVWRWNPNPDKTGFVQSPADPTVSSDEWTVWKRNDPTEQQLTRLVGNSAYLIRATSAVNLTVKQRVQPPLANWLVTGGNFLGFPGAASGDSAPLMSRYFASYPSAQSTVLSVPSKIYKYIGGDLGSSNPFLIAPGTERLDPNKAYWFNVATVSNFTAPVEYEVPSASGLAFGRSQSVISLGIMNRSNESLVLTIAREDSDSAPPSEPGVTGGVPLTRRTFNSTTNSYSEAPMGGSFTVTLPASGRTTLEFGIDRSTLSGGSGAFYASILRLQDSANLSDVRLPVSAQPATTAGLWVVNTTVNQVNSTVSGSGSRTAQSFPLVFLAHMDSGGIARLLSQAYVGRLTSPGNPAGIAISESKVLGFTGSDVKPVRYFACQMPTSIIPITGSGTMATGSTLSWTIPVNFDDPTNPFVHTYHPDHDNRDAKGTTLVNGKESFSINRRCEFTFTSSPPSGTYVAGWGTTILGGTYLEAISGLHKQVLQARGTFQMRRVSETATIDLTTP
jgi:hypothetical protein